MYNSKSNKIKRNFNSSNIFRNKKNGLTNILVSALNKADDLLVQTFPQLDREKNGTVILDAIPVRTSQQRKSIQKGRRNLNY